MSEEHATPPAAPVTKYLPVVQLRRDVAASLWHRPFAVLMALAEANTDGVRADQCPITGRYRLHRWTTPVKDSNGFTTSESHIAAPAGWAALYDCGNGRLAGKCSLLFQNW